MEEEAETTTVKSSRNNKGRHHRHRHAHRRPATTIPPVSPSSPDTFLSRRQREAEARSSILGQILEGPALDRLGRIRLVKASRAEEVENRLIMLARSGQLRQKVTEDQLKELLGSLSDQAGAKETVTVARRKGGWDDDDLEDLLEDG